MKLIGRKNKWLFVLQGAATVAALLLAGCSTTAVPAVLSPPAYTNSSIQPAAVQVRRHAVKSRLVTASRYDPRLAGNCTSNGESYDPQRLTAASRTLPLGSIVKVTNVNNGRSVNVRINDRGPFVRGRGLDLSGRAAENLGLGENGLAKVKITREAAAASPASAPCD